MENNIVFQNMVGDFFSANSIKEMIKKHGFETVYMSSVKVLLINKNIYVTANYEEFEPFLKEITIVERAAKIKNILDDNND